MFINRQIESYFKECLEYFPAVAIIGPRQVGKTTFVKEYFKKDANHVIFLDLESLSDLDKLNEPELFFTNNENKIIIIDEIQRKPELFSILRSIIDKKRTPGRFIILGSASPQIIRQSSESLAGRIAYIELLPFILAELDPNFDQNTLWFRGGFPDALLAPNDNLSLHWRLSFIKTYVERDLPLLGINAPSITIERLWTMVANINGQIVNYSTLANSLGIAVNTVRNYIDFFENAFLIKRLYPFSYNLNKRLVKSPKIYINDTGILHRLLKINSLNDLFGNSIIGSSWESFAIQQISILVKDKLELYFYRTHAGSECDLVLVKSLKPVISIEIKFTSSPGKNRSNTIAFNDLKTKYNFVITPSSDDYFLEKNIQVSNLKRFITFYLPDLLLKT